MRYQFERFLLDTRRCELFCHDSPLALRPLAFQVLVYLLKHRDRVVSKDELFEQIWTDEYVGDAALSSCLKTIRQVTQDSGQSQRIIRTVRGHGYRFVAPVIELDDQFKAAIEDGRKHSVSESVSESDRLADAAVTMAPSPSLVGRNSELHQLSQMLKQALAGERQLVLITGEAGIGKTTLIDTFVAQSSDPTIWIARGQCIEQYGVGEPYLPLLEALGRLGRRPEGTQFTDLMRRYAPNWLLQLPSLVSESDLESLHKLTGTGSTARMLRELAEAIEAISAEHPLVLLIEDLHWSDVSTLDWLVYMARRRDPARLLILGAYRPSDAITNTHPIHQAAHELQRQGRSQVLALDYLLELDVRVYLEQRFGNLAQQDKLAHTLHQRTTGNPLFLVAIVEELVRRGLLRLTPTGWTLTDDIDSMMRYFPESLKHLLEQQLNQLEIQDQHLLEIASVVGTDFTSASVSTCVESSIQDIESRYDTLIKRGQFLTNKGVVTWTDGTLTSRYGFVHALYQETLYEQVTARQRLQWHLSIGERLESGYGEHASEIAAELAAHFQRGQDTERAVHYLHTAGKIAAQRHAHTEAIAQFTKGLAVLQQWSESSQQTQRELELQMSLGPSLMATKGQASLDVEHTYTRARELCRQVGDLPENFLVLWGLWRFYYNQGQLRGARELSNQLLAVADKSTESTLRWAADVAHGTCLYFMGEFATAQAHLEQCFNSPPPEMHRMLAMRYGVAPGVQGHAFLAQTLWFLGYPDQALKQSQQSCELAHELQHPQSVGLALYYASRLQLKLRNLVACNEYVTDLLRVATEHEIPLWAALGTCQQGWILAMQGEKETGVTKLRDGLTQVLNMGTKLAKQVFSIALAECMQNSRDMTEGLALLREEENLIAETSQHYLEAEVYRFKGTLLLQQGNSTLSQAESAFQQALNVSRRQQSKALELRTAISLARLWQQQGKVLEARELLAPIYNWFTEGFDTQDLVDGKELLESLAALK